MLSNDNNKELSKKCNDKIQRFTLKKLSIGTASVLLGVTFTGISTASANSNSPSSSSNENNNYQSINNNFNLNNTDNYKMNATSTNSAVANSNSFDHQPLITPQADKYEDNLKAALTNTLTNPALHSSSSLDSTNTNNNQNNSSSNQDKLSQNNISILQRNNSNSMSTSPSAPLESSNNNANTQNQPTQSTTQGNVQNLTSSNTLQLTSSKDGSTMTPQEPVVDPVPLTYYNVLPPDAETRAKNAATGGKILGDFLDVLISPGTGTKIGSGINFIKDTVGLISQHPLAYQNYQNLTRLQENLAKQQQQARIKQQDMEANHPENKFMVHFYNWQQKQLANQQRNINNQRLGWLRYLKVDNPQSVSQLSNGDFFDKNNPSNTLTNVNNQANTATTSQISKLNTNNGSNNNSDVLSNIAKNGNDFLQKSTGILGNLIKNGLSGNIQNTVKDALGSFGKIGKGISNILDNFAPVKHLISLDQAQTTMDNGECPLDQAQNTADNGECPLDQAQNTVDNGECPLDQAQNTADNGECPLDQAQNTVDNGECPLDQAQNTADNGECPLDQAQNTFNNGNCPLDQAQNTFNNGNCPLDQAQNTFNNGNCPLD
ncbi:YSIRK-type signal peptide-containing protein, partial [Lactobacillus reuteri]|nr:YSIRK-type signal peptide-containing protein [Limosilactobacillus reuteri]